MDIFLVYLLSVCLKLVCVNVHPKDVVESIQMLSFEPAPGLAIYVASGTCVKKWHEFIICRCLQQSISSLCGI